MSDRYDVVIVGFGGAGACAAIEAHDAGAKVLILDKGEGGGNTLYAGGNIRMIRDAEKATQHFDILSEGTTDHASIEAHVSELSQLPEWLQGLGGVIESDERAREQNFVDEPPYCPREYVGSAFPSVPGSEGLGGRYRWPMHDGIDKGRSCYRMLRHNVIDRNIDIATGHRASSLMRNEATGRVTGIRATDSNGQDVTVTADSGVVLSCGGFGWDPALQRSYLGAAMPSISPPHGNTGDGVRMAMAIGADLWHMTSAAYQLGISVPGFEAAFHLRARGKSFIIVDQRGQRFTDEASLASHDGGILLEGNELRTGRRMRFPAYLVFDENTRKAGPVVALDRGFNRGADWSEDNSHEVELGWIASAANAVELGSTLGIDADGLNTSITAFNQGIAVGQDQFARSMRYSEPLEGRLYAIGLRPTIVNTQGGPRRSHEGRVLDPFGEVIPGLFSAGELGSIWDRLYPGGGNFGEALTSGRVAGRSAAER